jgi:cytochrome c peroxidase
MNRHRTTLRWGAGLALALVVLAACRLGARAQKGDLADRGLEWQLPNESWITPFAQQQPITFVNHAQNPDEWEKLPAFWNVVAEKAVDPASGQAVERKAVRIKVPLGLTQNPPVPPENPLTVAKWQLGKDLFFDKVLSSNGTIACASCHDPRKGYTDQARFSTGISGKIGGMSAPTVLNSAYNRFQFWDGRAFSLEDQAQGPVGNALEMFGGDGHAWASAVERVRKKDGYTARFRQVFGTNPTRDAIAKALAAYERTVLGGNSIHDRAELAMRARAEDEGTGKFELKDVDYEKVLREAFAKKDVVSLTALALDPVKDAARAPALGAAINRGRALFFGRARCNSCHVGDNFTDNDFHNIGVGVKDGALPPNAQGRIAILPTGHKNPDSLGAFKTPTVRGLLGTGPFMHDGSEATLEKVVEFYDKGGNANEYLDAKMRDIDAERLYLAARKEGKPWKGPKVEEFGPSKRPIIPLKLNLTEQEKKDLVLFLRALHGDPVDPMVANPR